MPSLCQDIKLAYEHLQTLKERFISEYAKSKDSGDLTMVKQLKAQWEEAYKALEAKLYIGWTLKGNLNKQESKVLLAEYTVDNWVSSVVFSPDGKKVAMRSGDNKMCVLGEK